MTLDELKMGISDLTGVEPRSIGSDREAKEAATWVEMQKRAEADAESLLDPVIKKAYAEHKRLTGEKKSLLEKLLSAKDRVRAGLANWIAAGHDVQGCYIKTTFRVTVNDAEQIPDDYAYRAIDEKKLAEWAKVTEGKVAIPGCTIEPVRVLYAKETA
jgi:hypothetical protein